MPSAPFTLPQARVPVLWCWLEGEAEIGWYHRLDCGFPGRRPV